MKQMSNVNLEHKATFNIVSYPYRCHAQASRINVKQKATRKKARFTLYGVTFLSDIFSLIIVIIENRPLRSTRLL